MKTLPNRLTEKDFQRSDKLLKRVARAKSDLALAQAEWGALMLDFAETYGFSQGDEVMNDHTIKRALPPKK